MGNDAKSIQEAIRKLRASSVPPLVVKNKRQANAMSRRDKILFGKYAKVWKVGDEYYEMTAHPDTVEMVYGR